MVLHNNKWDKKATRAYNRKHNIQAPKEDRPVAPKDSWKRESADDSEGDNASARASPVESEPEEEQIPAEQPLYPDLEEQSQEEQDLIRKHVASVAAQGPQRTYRSHVTVSKDSNEFDSICSDIEYSRMTRDLKRRFGNSKPLELEEIDDFDEFMDNPWTETQEPEPVPVATVEVDPKKQAFVDKLLR